MNIAALLMAVATVSAVGTWAARRYALARRLIDEPGARRSHVVPTPRGGGVGPVLGIAIAFVVGWGGLPGVAIAAGVLAVAAIGAWDDHRPLSPVSRLFVHAVAAAVVAAALHSPIHAPFAFALVWFTGVALINIWNFMDGIDGIASIQAVLVALVFASLASRGIAPVAVAVAAACAAFVPFNFPRARVFMGDVGSGAIGLAIAALAASVAGDRPETALRATLPLSAFLVDASITLARRMLRGERWWTPHSQHLYQVLARRFGHPPVTAAYAAWTVVAGLLASRTSPELMMPVWGICYTGGISLWLTLQWYVGPGRSDRKEEHR